MNVVQIYDFGSQYTQLIARKIRELNVYSEILPYYEFPSVHENVKGIILSGSPYSVLDSNAPTINFSKRPSAIPILGICYGAQLYAYRHGGKILRSTKREYGRAYITNFSASKLLQNIPENTQVWMSHSDAIITLPPTCKRICSTENSENAAFEDPQNLFYGVQFHPEVFHTTEGTNILKNFVFHICNINPDWSPSVFVNDTISKLKEQLNNHKVIIGVSGGVDSTVAATILHKAIGKNLYCIFVDNGLLRKNEYENVIRAYQDMGLQVLGVNAKETFLNALRGITDPELKRKAIGKTFIEVFEQEAKKIDNVEYLAQGTIYPDVIESKSVFGPSSTIKSHHNVGGLPERLNLKIIEPLRYLFKDEVRDIGYQLQVPEFILKRHPFPGPGLAVRIIGEVTAENLEILREADHIFISKLIEQNLYDTIWQAFAVLLPIQTVGVMGDKRTYEKVIALRAVCSTDGMTADWAQLPHDFLASVSNQIINSIPGINRVVYDISSKPPATIEWE